jgi:SAM-dependent methyltransferase
MAYTAAGSRHSADVVVRLMLSALPITSVLDVGCATGTWLRAWREQGVGDIHGVDGDYVERSQLAIPERHFTAADLGREISLGRTFDLVQSLEVAEHLEPSVSEIVVATIARHSRGLVLFSAAPPGQGGEHHINENTYEFWRELFSGRGFRAFDFVRPRLRDDRSVAFWYRYNIVLYVHDEKIPTLPAEIRATRVADHAPIADLSPLAFRVRKAIVRRLPRAAQTRIAQIKARLVTLAST